MVSTHSADTQMHKGSCCVPPEGADVCWGLITTTKRGHAKCVEFILHSGAHVNNISFGLLEAVKYGHKECVESLIKAGADVNMRNAKKITPLILAAQEGYVSCLELLIEAGANVNLGQELI